MDGLVQNYLLIQNWLLCVSCSKRGLSRRENWSNCFRLRALVGAEVGWGARRWQLGRNSEFCQHATSSLCACSAAQMCPTLCDPMYCSLPGSSVHGILQVRILKWVVISSSSGSCWPRDWTHVSCIFRQFLYHWVTWVTQSTHHTPWQKALLWLFVVSVLPT